MPTLEVSPTEINLFIEEEAKVEVTLNGKDVTDQVTYKSDSELIAIAEKGVVKAKYIEGTAKIAVSLEGANSATFTVNVTDDSTPVTLNEDVLNKLHELEIIEKSYANIKDLKEIDIPAIFTYKGTKYKIISINYSLFSYCSLLKKVTLPDSLETISQFAFGNCSSLEEMTIRDDIVCIFPSAFLNCSNLTKLTTKSGKEINLPESNIETVDNVTFISVKLQTDSQGYSTITNITIPNGLTAIPTSALRNCTSLPNITIPQSIKTIGESAFENCRALKNVTIPDSVITVGKAVFSDCVSLESVTIGKNVTTIKGEAFYNCTNSGLTIDISKSNVTSIEDMAFYNVNNIKINEDQNLLDDGRHWGAKNVTIVNPQNN